MATAFVIGGLWYARLDTSMAGDHRLHGWAGTSLWSRPRPRWLDAHRGGPWGTIAILDNGPSSFIFEDRRPIPLGANVAVRPPDLPWLSSGADGANHPRDRPPSL